MQLFRSFNDNIREFRHHVNTHRPAVAIFYQFVPHSGGYIPQNHPAISLLYLIENGVRPFRNIQAFGYIIFILPAGKLPLDILNGPVPINQQKLSGREKLPVNPAGQPCIAGSKHHLS